MVHINEEELRAWIAEVDAQMAVCGDEVQRQMLYKRSCQLGSMLSVAQAKVDMVAVVHE